MSSKAVLVTGAAGRLGSVLMPALLKEKFEVRALVEKHEHKQKLPQGVKSFVGDIGDADLLAKACVGVDTIFHLAAIVSQFSSGPKELIRVNARGTARLLDAADAANVSHLIFPSSVDVYGRARREKLTEDSLLKPTDMYGHSKMLAEELIKETSKPTYTIFRIAAIYGPGFEKSFFKVFEIIRDGKARIIGKGDNRIALVHISDVVRAFLLAERRAISRGKVYNLSDGAEYTQNSLYNLAADMLDVPRPTNHISPLLVSIVAKAKGLNTDEIRFITSNRSIDTAKIRKELGFKPGVGIKKGAGDLIKRFMHHAETVRRLVE